MPVKQESSSQLMPFPGYSPIPINNRFNPLSHPSLRPNYQSALVSQFDPFIVNPSIPIPSKRQSPVNRSRYAARSHTNLFVVESYLEGLNDPAKIAKKFFPPNLHYFPSHPSKSIKFYRDILYETQSIEIRPIKDKETDATIFHSLYTRQILMPDQWSKNPYDQLPLQTDPQLGLTYNYGDYIDAWYTIFYHQHPDFSHSWFLNFDAKFKAQFPFWFLQRWNIHGPIWEIIPVELQNSVNYFSQKHKLTKPEKFFPMLLHFMAKYRVPWILKWNYQVNWESRVLSRHFAVKWWDKVQIHKIIFQVNTEFPPLQAPVNPVNVASPSSSNATLKGKSKKEFTELAEQILAQVTQMKDDDASPKSESSSSQQMPSQPFSQKPKPRWSDYVPDSQDPYDLNED